MTTNQAEPGTTSPRNEAPAPDTETPTAPPATADEECVDCLPRSRDDDFPFTGCGCGDCDSESIEILCQAEGIKARAAYDAEHAGAPSPERYEQARLAYGESRYAVTPLLDDLQTKLDDAMHEITCRIDDPDKLDCLDRSWQQVRRRLRDCRAAGCCVERYEFHRAPKDAEVEELKATEARYAYVTWHAATCFDRLAREPELLRQRVVDLTSEIMTIYYQVFPEKMPPAAPVKAESTPAAVAIEGAGVPQSDANQVGGDTQVKGVSEEEAPPSGKPDWPNLYAAGLVAGSHLDHVYWGFDDPQDYVRCLCRAMKVAMEGHAAIAELCGELRVREARWEERNKCCKRLKEHAAAEIMPGYVRCVRGDPDTDEEPGCEDCDDDDHDHPHHHHDHDDRHDRRRRRDDDDDLDVDVEVEVDVRAEDDDDRPPRRGRRREADPDDDDDHYEDLSDDRDDRSGARDRRRSSSQQPGTSSRARGSAGRASETSRR